MPLDFEMQTKLWDFYNRQQAPQIVLVFTNGVNMDILPLHANAYVMVHLTDTL